MVSLRSNVFIKLTEFLNPGPDRSPILYTKKVMFVLIYKSDQYINDSHQGGL